jgi:hypothetical protein
MNVNEARIRTEKEAREFAAVRVKNGYDIVIVAYDDRPKYLLTWRRPWLVIYG